MLENLFLDPQTGLPGAEALYASLHRENKRFVLMGVSLFSVKNVSLSALEIEWSAHLLRHVAHRHEGIYRLDAQRFILLLDGAIPQVSLQFKQKLETERAALSARTGVQLGLLLDVRSHLPGFEQPIEVLHDVLEQLRKKERILRVQQNAIRNENELDWVEKRALAG